MARLQSGANIPQPDTLAGQLGWKKRAQAQVRSMQRSPGQLCTQLALDGWGGTIWSGERANCMHTLRLHAASEPPCVLAIGDHNH